MTHQEAVKLSVIHKKEVITWYIKSSMMDAVTKYLNYQYEYYKRYKNEDHHREMIDELFSSFEGDADEIYKTLLEVLGDEL